MIASPALVVTGLVVIAALGGSFRLLNFAASLALLIALVGVLVSAASFE